MNGQDPGINRDRTISMMRKIREPQRMDDFSRFNRNIGRYTSHLVFTVLRKVFEQTPIVFTGMNNILISSRIYSKVKNDILKSRKPNLNRYIDANKKYFATWFGKYSYKYTDPETDCPVFIQGLDDEQIEDGKETMSNKELIALIDKSFGKKKERFNFNEEEFKCKMSQMCNKHNVNYNDKSSNHDQLQPQWKIYCKNWSRDEEQQVYDIMWCMGYDEYINVNDDDEKKLVTRDCFIARSESIVPPMVGWKMIDDDKKNKYPNDCQQWFDDECTDMIGPVGNLEGHECEYEKQTKLNVERMFYDDYKPFDYGSIYNLHDHDGNEYGLRVIKYKNYLFVSEKNIGYTNTYTMHIDTKISIWKINITDYDESDNNCNYNHSVKFWRQFELPHFEIDPFTYIPLGDEIIIVPSSMSNNDDSKVELLVFGSSFCQPRGPIRFCHVVVDFGTIAQGVQVYCPPEYMSIDSDYNSYAMDLPYSNFSYHVIDNRYLVLIGGLCTARGSVTSNINQNFNGNHNQDYPSDKIIVYDYWVQKWFECKYRLPIKMINHKSFVFENGQKLYLIGDIDNKQVEFVFKIRASIAEWKIQRLIWIGFFKNENNNLCLLTRVPKDLIVYMLRFLRGRSLFSVPL